jgi:hypothetical protein
MKNHKTKTNDSLSTVDSGVWTVDSKPLRTRTGKIARLPESIREQLNQQLSDGVLGKDTVPWLNSLPEVKQVLAEHFAGRPISEHNISEWRHGGYQDWLRDQETRARVVHIIEKYQHLESEGRLGRRIESVLVAELADDMNQLYKIKNDAVRSARLHRICRELARLQNLHCRGLELRLQQERAATQPSQTATTRSY